ncbi:MAG: carbohydrate ABC transporter permease [Anaerolineae bacterium]|nr:carbohydrate ABC transporter permease [Anaerolineae bacterium]NUQ03372.1 carbohydrate ABC transporter permease [Anaerolineae bacterium]
MNRRIGTAEKFSTYLILAFLSIAMIAPFLLMLSISLTSDTSTVQMDFHLIPQEFQFDNYVRVFTTPNIDLGRHILNSLIIVVGSITGQVLVSSFVAFGFARFNAPGKNALFLILLGTMMIPGAVTLIPQFALYRALGWLGTFAPLIVPNFFGGAFNIFLIRQFIVRLPTELDEAAKIDGVGPVGIFWYIIFPLIRPIAVAVAILTFQFNWSWFLEPLLYLQDAELMPLAVAARTLSATTSAGATPMWNLVMVASMLLTVPMLLVFFFGQKYVFEANLSGGSASIK